MWSPNKFVVNLKEKGIQRLLFCGDIHGEFNTFLNNVKRLGENALIIVCGDISFGFNKPQYYLDTLKKYEIALSKLNSYVAFVRGNHDDPRWFNNLDKVCPELETYYPHVWIIKDYQTILTEQGNILCFGGARSVDKNWRVKGTSWWEGEMPLEMSEEFKQYIEEESPIIDYVATHSSPNFCEPKSKHGLAQFYIWDKEVYKDCERERDIITDVYKFLVDNNTPIKKWFYGHFHYHYKSIINVRNEIETRFIGLDRCRLSYDSDVESIGRDMKLNCDFYEINTAGYDFSKIFLDK